MLYEYEKHTNIADLKHSPHPTSFARKTHLLNCIPRTGFLKANTKCFLNNLSSRFHSTDKSED